MTLGRIGWGLAVFFALHSAAFAQIIHFESGGMSYQTLSKNGLTIMYALLPSAVREYTVIVQAAVSNGSTSECTLLPEDFSFQRPNGRELRADTAQTVVAGILRRASGDDVIRLVSTYEIGIYGLGRFKSTNGFEQRRQSAQAAISQVKLRAAAAASAIAFVEVKLKPGDSTDGAVFFPARGQPITGSRLHVSACGESFEFEAVAAGPQ
jgi:hypothetical protein